MEDREVLNDDIYQPTSYVLAWDAPGLLIYPRQGGEITNEYTIEGEWPLRIVELPTNANVSEYGDFVQTLGSNVKYMLWL